MRARASCRDCLHTVAGKGIVESAVLVPAVEGDVTFSIELKDAGLVVVGGVFTHAKMAAHVPIFKERSTHTGISMLKKVQAKTC